VTPAAVFYQLQVEGTIVAAVLLTGLSSVWLASAERLPAGRATDN
jgi:hypothetical protein